MLTLQIVNPGNMGVMSCLGQGGLCSLSALVAVCDLVRHDLGHRNNPGYLKIRV